MLQVCFDCYGTYTTDSVYQWDLNRRLAIHGLDYDSAPAIHFSNKKSTEALVVQSTIEDGVIYCDVPNILLQDPYDIVGYVCESLDQALTTYETIRIPVKPRVKPADYAYENNVEILTYYSLIAEITSVKASTEKGLKSMDASKASKAELNAVKVEVETAHDTDINRVENEIASERARIDQLVASPEMGEGDFEKEVEDLRVDRKGTTHGSAGTAVRAQIQELDSKIDDNVSTLSSEIEDLGYYKRYHVASPVWVGTDGVQESTTIHFRAIQVSGNTTGLLLYGVYGENTTDGYDTLIRNAEVGVNYNVVTERNYHHLQVATSPANGSNYVFDLLIGEPIGLYGDMLDIYSEIEDLGYYKRYHSGINSIWIGTDGVQESTTIHFRTIQVSGNTTGLNLYGMYGENDTDGYDTLIRNAEVGVNYNIVTERNYHHLQVATRPTNGSNYVFDLLIGEPIGLYGDIHGNARNIIKSLLNRTTCKIFKKVVCCGDSYTSGHIQLPNGTVDKTNEDYAWAHYMGTTTGNEWINCGCSGCTVLTWQSHERGLPLAQSKGKAQAYVIGLLLNDISHVPLGSIEDIGTEAQTYYGGMSKIVRELHAINSSAKIFVNTCPRSGGNYTLYNQAIRDIVSAYKATYPIHCIDLEAVKDLYTNTSLTSDFVNDHYTAIGYEQFAEIYAYVLSDYINNHVSEFQDVYKIPYDN